MSAIAPLQGAVPPLEAELVLALEGAHADGLHEGLSHAGVPSAHAALLLLQLETVAQLVVSFAQAVFWLGAQRQEGQGFITRQPGQGGAQKGITSELDRWHSLRKARTSTKGKMMVAVTIAHDQQRHTQQRLSSA